MDEGMTVEVALSPEEVLERATRMMVEQGYAVQGQSPSMASFALPGKRDDAFGCILLLLGILPGLLYFLLSNPKTIHVTILAYPHEGGSRLVVGGNSPPHVEGVLQWVRTLTR